MRKIASILAAVAIAAVSLVACGNDAHASTETWMCTAPGSGRTVVTSNYNYVHYLYQVGWRCSYVYPV